MPGGKSLLKRGGTKARNVVMSLYVACLYLFDIGFWVAIFTEVVPLFYVGVAFGVLSFPLLGIIIALSIFKFAVPDSDSLKFSMIFKLIMIPFFCSNFVICTVVVAGFANVWLIWSLPVVLAVVIILTYLCVVGSSAFAVSYIGRRTLEGKIDTQTAIINVILHFTFVLDVISSIYMYRKYGRNKNIEAHSPDEESESDPNVIDVEADS